ncbi:MAG: PH domain-containing protein [Sciscionella sp.]|nr:PH domain-containing protein [Sciscionella sp.]
MPDQQPPEHATDQRSRRVVFRIPAVSVLVVLFLALAAVPIAASAWWLPSIYLLHLIALGWIARTRTTVDGERIVARRLLISRSIPWSAVTSLRLAERSWVRAVLADGGSIALPAVRARHLPMLAAVSAGRVPDPLAHKEKHASTEQVADTEEAASEPADEPTAQRAE